MIEAQIEGRMAKAIEQMPSVSQMLVLPRGIEPKATAYEGQVLYDSPESGDSYDRAVFAGLYAATHPALRRAIIVSQETFAVPFWRHCKGSEAEAIRNVAVKHGLKTHNAQDVVANKSRSTLGGFLEAYPHVDRGQPLGVVVHKDHWPKAEWLGKIVLRDVELVPLFADNPDRQKPNVEQASSDQRSDLVYKLALAGVEAGNIEGLLRGSALRERAVAASMGIIAAGMHIKKAYSAPTGKHRI